jgi:integrase
MESVLLNAAGYRRSPATLPGYHRGRPPRNKGEEYPPDPPTVEEIVAVIRTVGDRPEAHRVRALIVLLWRAGLRISEALALQESDLDRGRGAVLVRRRKGGKRRARSRDGPLGMGPARPMARDPPRAPDRRGAVRDSRTHGRAGRRWEASAARKQLHHAAAAAGVRRRFAPHHYADLWVVPIRRGEMLQVAALAVGLIGITHGPWRARS